MDRALGSLTRLFMYFDTKTQRPYCNVHFKGDLECFEIVPVDTLLGDILHISETIDLNSIISNEHCFEYLDKYKDCCESSKVIFHMYAYDSIIESVPNILQCLWSENEDINYKFWELGLSLSDSKKECIKWLSNEENQIYFLKNFNDGKTVYNILQKFSDFLDLISEKGIQFSSDTLGAFQYTYGINLYSCTRKAVDEHNRGEQLATEFTYSPYSLADSLLCDDLNKLVYEYECDNLSEVILALLHYISITGLTLNKCKRCGRWFSPAKKADEKYCLRQYTPSKNCRQLAAHATRMKHITEHPVIKKENSVLQNLRNWVERSVTADERIDRMLKRADFKKELALRKAQMTEYELFDWLDTVKVKGNSITWKK